VLGALVRVKPKSGGDSVDEVVAVLVDVLVVVLELTEGEDVAVVLEDWVVLVAVVECPDLG